MAVVASFGQIPGCYFLEFEGYQLQVLIVLACVLCIIMTSLVVFELTITDRRLFRLLTESLDFKRILISCILFFWSRAVDIIAVGDIAGLGGQLFCVALFLAPLLYVWFMMVDASPYRGRYITIAIMSVASISLVSRLYRILAGDRFI
jgi:hypothetical protein